MSLASFVVPTAATLLGALRPLEEQHCQAAHTKHPPSPTTGTILLSERSIRSLALHHQEPSLAWARDRMSAPPTISDASTQASVASSSNSGILHDACHLPSAKLAKTLGKRVLDDADSVGSLKPTVIQKVDAKAARRDARSWLAASELWEALLQLGPRGTMWAASLDNVEFRKKAANTKISKWAASNSVDVHNRILKTWIAWCMANDMDWKSPDVFTVTEFLKERCSDRPTKARSYFNSLFWLETRIGLSACTKIEEVRRAADPPPDHVAEKEPPWIMGLLFVIEKGMESGNVFLASLCLFYAFLGISGVRPIHTQRLVLTLRKNFAEFVILQGKRRVRGRQTKVFMGCPYKGYSSVSMHGMLSKMLDMGFCCQ